MKNQTKRSIVFLFTIIFMMGVIINLNSKDTNLNYNIKNEDTSLKSSNNEIIINTPDNITYTEPMSGYYPATYGFENDLNGAIPFNWIDTSSPPCYAKVVNGIGGHNKVIEVYGRGQTSSDYAHITNYFQPQVIGTIEWWWRKSSSLSSCAKFDVLDDTNELIDLRMDWYADPGKIEYEENGWVNTGYSDYADDKWIHMKLSFDCTTDMYNLTIDGVLYLNNTPFHNGDTATYISRIRFYTYAAANPTLYYVDGVGYSWDPNYDIGDNLDEGILLGYENSTSLDWQGYSLDHTSNKTILGNTTIPMPIDGQHQIQVFGNDSIGTMYQSNTKYFSVDTTPYIEISTPENKTYSEPMSGYYPGSYGFENYLQGELPSDWWYWPHDGSGYYQITSELNDHNNILEMRKIGGTTKVEARKNFSVDATSGTVEFWLYKDTEDTNDATRLFLMDKSDNIALTFFIEKKDLFLDTWWDRILLGDNVFDKNIWHYIRVDFSIPLGGWQLEVDGTSYGTGYAYPFEAPVSEVSEFRIASIYSADYPNYGAYIDALSYSWDSNYNIGDNLNEGLLLSYDNTTNFHWKGYSLDGQSNKTIYGNTTIPMPIDGQHQIQVFGNDSVGVNYRSDLRYFSVGSSSVNFDEWQYFREINLNPSTPEADYQVNIKLNSTNFDYDHLNSNGSDIRFYDEFHNPLNYWVETWNYGGDSLIWVKIPSMGTSTFLMCYGNSFAPSESNGEGVFLLYDDFEGTSLNPAKWTSEGDAYSFISVSGGVVRIYSDCPSTYWPRLTLGFHDYWKDHGETYSWHSITGGATFEPSEDIWLTGEMHWINSTSGPYYENDVFYSEDINNPDGPLSVRLTTDTTYYGPGTGWGSWITSVDDTLGQPGRALRLRLWSDRTGIADLRVDWVAVLKYSELNPDISIGLENEFGLEITINTPLANSLYGTVAPDFNITIDDPDYDFTWYSLDGGSTNIYSNETIGKIDQTEWDKIGNGTATIIFYANDTANNIGQAEVTIRKDILAPLIVINSPSENQVCGVDAPTFDLTIFEHEVNSTWYTLDYGSVNTSFSGSTGTIDQTEWAKKGGGIIPIRFYANDSFGHESFTDVTIIKDITLPLITINSPGVKEIFGDSPPDYDISITEPNLDFFWYTLDGGAINISISNYTGIIDQTEWNKQGNGTVTIIFFARDEGGNEDFAEIIVRKEIIAPTITINSPLLNEIYSGSSPSYSVIINDRNLDSYWYTLDGGAINISISSLTGIIDQTEWNKHGNGTITIKFFANDTLGNENYQEVTIRKDVSAPIITIDSPVLNDIVGYNPPNYEITVIDSQLDSMWYTIDNGLINITITNKAGTIDQTEWEKNQGVNVLIKFYANDTLGNTAYSEVAIIKNVLHGIDYIELLTPSINSRIFSNLLDFSWTSLDIGVNFTLQVSSMSDFSHIVFQSENIAETPTVTNFSVPLSIIQGQYYWRVRSTYGNYIGNWSDYFSFTLHINDYSPNLALDDFSPTTGTKDTIFRFTVIYSDLDNNAPEYVKILINEISYFMEKLNPSDIDFTDGCIYQFITLLTPSTTNYTISFECSDGAFQYSTSTYQGPLVESGSTPSNNQGDNNLFSTNIFAITIIFGITIGSIIPSIVIVEKKVRKMKLGEKTSTKIKKKTIKS